MARYRGTSIDYDDAGTRRVMTCDAVIEDDNGCSRLFYDNGTEDGICFATVDFSGSITVIDDQIFQRAYLRSREG